MAKKRTRLTPNHNTLNALVLWGILSPKQLAKLMGVSVSFCSRELKKLVALGLATYLGKAKLPVTDPLFGSYYIIGRSRKIAKITNTECSFRLRKPSNIGDSKTVQFSGGLAVSRHTLMAASSTFWVADSVVRMAPETNPICFPETYLRRKLGWHRGMGPARGAANPRLTAVPDSLVICGGYEIRIEAELTPKSKKVYREIFEHIRKRDDLVFYIFPDAQTQAIVNRRLPDGYRISSVVWGDQLSMEAEIRKQLPSLFEK